MSDIQPFVATDEIAFRFGKDHRAQLPTIAIVEPRKLYRECLAVLLSRAFPNYAIEPRDRVDDLSARQKLVILLCFDKHAIQSPLTLKRKIGFARTLWADVPLAIVVDELEHNASRMLARIGFAGMVETSSCAATVVEMVQSLLRETRVALTTSDDLETSDGRHEHEGAFLRAPDTSENISTRHLTARECDILRLLHTGDQNKSIAFRLGISESTVKVHLRHLMLKFNARNRTQLVIGAKGQTP